jgi:hypothetical protein
MSGEAGRLTKVLTVGVMGVLEGRGPRSMELVGNGDREAVMGGSGRVSADACLEELREPVPVRSGGIFSPSSSSSSSIDGKC